MLKQSIACRASRLLNARAHSHVGSPSGLMSGSADELPRAVPANCRPYRVIADKAAGALRKLPPVARVPCAPCAIAPRRDDGSGTLHPPRRRRRIDDVVDFLAPAQNLRRQNRMIESLQIQIVDRPALDPLLDHAVDAPGHHDLVGLGFVAQPRRKVGDAADRGVFQPLLEADLAERGVAQRDADAEAEIVAAVAPLARSARRWCRASPPPSSPRARCGPRTGSAR